MGRDVKTLAKSLRALGDQTRLKILQLLWVQGETCVCELMEALQMTQSNISFHLNILRHAGLVTDRKMGKWVFYNAHDEAIAELGSLGGLFDVQKRFSERSPDSIYALCCSGEKPLSREQVAAICKSRKQSAIRSATNRKQSRKVGEYEPK